MSLVEETYERAMDAMPTAQKMARVEAFLVWTRNLIARQVRETLGPEADDERVRWEVALRMYESEPAVARLIREHMARGFS